LVIGGRQGARCWSILAISAAAGRAPNHPRRSFISRRRSESGLLSRGHPVPGPRPHRH